VLGGWLTDAVSWRAVFFINLPIAAVAVALVFVGARESKGDASGPLDLAGAAVVTLGLGLVTWAFTEAGHKGATPAAGAALALGVAALVAFVLIERKAKSPLAPLELFRSVSFSGLNGLTLMLYAAFGGALFLLPFELIRAQQFTAAQAGAALLPLSVGLAVLSPLAGRIAGRVGARAMLTAGPWLVAAGFAVLAWRADVKGYWSGVFPGLALMATGMGVAVAPLTDAILGAVPDEREGAASGINNAVARVAGLLAVALVGFVLGGADARAVAAGYRTAMLAAAGAAVIAGLLGLLTTAPRKR
jgi:MFS family permease